MHRPTWAATLLSLGTSAEESSAIEGDLIEERRSRGRFWFAWQVMLVSLRLFLRALLATPAHTLLIGYAVYELAIKLQWWAITPIRRLLRFDLALPATTVLSATLALWVLAGSLIGVLLVRLMSTAGFRAAVVAIVLLHLRLLILDSQISPALVLAFGAIPLLCGGLLAHRHNLSRLPAPVAAT